MLRYRLYTFFHPRVVEVVDRTNPTHRVYVKRGWIQRLLFNPTKSEDGERHLSCAEAMHSNCMVYRL